MEIVVNGEPRSVAAGVTAAELLLELQLRARGVALERNRELVPRAALAECVLQPGDVIEIVTFVGGG